MSILDMKRLGETSVTMGGRDSENFTAGLTGRLELPTWEVGDEEATRGAYGAALKALGGAREDVVALDGEVSNSTKSEEFAKDYPGRYFEMFIAEQQMVSAAVGMSVRHRVPFASSFAAFLSRAYDFIRMAAISRANIRLSGSHAGVSIGEDARDLRRLGGLLHRRQQDRALLRRRRGYRRRLGHHAPRSHKGGGRTAGE